MLVGFGFCESEWVDLVAGDGWEFAYFFEDVLGEVLAAWFDDVAFVFEDVVEWSTKWVISQLSPAALFYHVFHFYYRRNLRWNRMYTYQHSTFVVYYADLRFKKFIFFAAFYALVSSLCPLRILLNIHFYKTVTWFLHD